MRMSSKIDTHAKNTVSMSKNSLMENKKREVAISCARDFFEYYAHVRKK